MKQTESNRKTGMACNIFPSPWLALLIAVIALAAVAWPSIADAQDDSWRIGLELAWVDPSGNFSATENGTTAYASYDTGFGAGLRGEYQFGRRLGVELSALGAGSVQLSAGSAGSSVEVSTVAPVMLGFNVHLTPDRPVDLYVGSMLALVRYSDVVFRAGFGSVSTTVSVEDDFAWGVIAGLEIPMGSRGWQVQANLRFLDTDIRDSGGPISINSEFDPLIFSIGIGYRF